MLKGFGSTENGSPLMIIGLTKLNLMKLQDGMPIVAPLADWRLQIDGTAVSAGEVLITYGETVADLQAQFARPDGSPVPVEGPAEVEVAPPGPAVEGIDPKKFTWVMVPPGSTFNDGHAFQCDHSVIVVMNDEKTADGETPEGAAVHMEVWNTDVEHPGTRLIMAVKMIAAQLESSEDVQLKVVGRSLAVTLDTAMANLRTAKNQPPQLMPRGRTNRDD